MLVQLMDIGNQIDKIIVNHPSRTHRKRNWKREKYLCFHFLTNTTMTQKSQEKKIVSTQLHHAYRRIPIGTLLIIQEE